MKAKNTDKLERENRQLKRDNLLLKKKIQELEEKNYRLVMKLEQYSSPND